VNGEGLKEEERKLWHLDRISFGTRTILIFKYPMQKRKLAALKRQIMAEDEELPNEAAEEKAKAELQTLLPTHVEHEEGEEEEEEKYSIIADEYSHAEEEEDMAGITWEMA